MLSICLNSAVVQRRLAGHSVVCGVVAAFLALFLLPSYVHDRLTGFFVYATLASLSFLVAYFLFIAFRCARTTAVSMVLDAESLLIPRLLFPGFPRRVELADITSIEELSYRGTTNLVIGRKGRYPIFVEQALCAQPGDIITLKDQLGDHLRRVGKDDGITSSVLAGKTHTQQAWREVHVGVLLSLLTLAFYISTDGFSETIVSERLVYSGANTAAILQDLEVHRLFSSFFLHYNPTHLIGNCVLYAVIGQFIVRILGPVRFYNVVFLSSMTAVLVSSCFIGEDASFGASGGGFGLLGAYTVIKWRYEDRLTALLNPMPNWVLALVLLLELVVGLYNDVIDLNNHLGGFFAGAAYALALPANQDTSLDKAVVPEFGVLAVSVAAYAYGFAQLFGTPAF